MPYSVVLLRCSEQQCYVVVCCYEGKKPEDLMRSRYKKVTACVKMRWIPSLLKEPVKISNLKYSSFYAEWCRSIILICLKLCILLASLKFKNYKLFEPNYFHPTTRQSQHTESLSLLKYYCAWGVKCKARDFRLSNIAVKCCLWLLAMRFSS